jgi:hypothetical protein
MVSMGWLGRLTRIGIKLGLSPERAGGIVAVIGAIKFAYNLFAPSSMKATLPTGGKVITQKATT